MAYRITVDPDVCISAGRCVAEAPALLRFADEVVPEIVPGASLPDDATLLELARGCPSGALQVLDGDTVVDPY